MNIKLKRFWTVRWLRLPWGCRDRTRHVSGGREHPDGGDGIVGVRRILRIGQGGMGMEALQRLLQRKAVKRERQRLCPLQTSDDRHLCALANRVHHGFKRGVLRPG
jgi:hypothetical protein